MSDPHNSGFSDRGQEPFGDIPTEPDAFLEWAASRSPDDPFRYELSRGNVSRMMIKVSRAHWRISKNLLAELLRKVDDTQSEAGPAEFGVKTLVGVRFPDVVVDHLSPNLKDLACEAPIFIAEVLSPSTTALDLTTKQQEYTALPSLQTYLVCSQDAPLAWVWTRRPDASWPAEAETFEGRDIAIPLAGLDIELSMAAIFRGIPDAPTL